MSPSLSSNPDIAQLKRQAKELLKAQKGGDPSVCDRLRKIHRFAKMSNDEILAADIKLAEAQHALAKDYGFNSWPDLSRGAIKSGKKNILHIHSGDSAAASLRKSSIAGEVISSQDPVYIGPVPDGVSDQEYREIRARFFVERGYGTYEAGLQGLTGNHEKLAQVGGAYEEVVLWFDACLFDQTMLIHLIDRLARVDTGKTRLSLICVGEHPGFARFDGLGQLSPEQMAALFPSRHEITRAEKNLAVKAWKAFRSDNPMAIEDVLKQDCSALPYLAAAFRRHLEQYPAVADGLDRLQREALEVVASGKSKLGEIFGEVSKKEQPAFFSDDDMWAYLDEMAGGNEPLLKIEGPGSIKRPLRDPLKEIGRWSVTITKTGRDVLAGEKDFISLNGIDRWLGGVHLRSDETRGEVRWRWDTQKKQLIENFTALHVAALSGNTKAVRASLRGGGDATARDKTGYSALHHAAAFCDAETVKALIDAGCDVNAANSQGHVPLHSAAWFGNDATIEVLIANGANVNARYAGHHRQSVLFNAAMFGNKRAVELLIAAGADVNLATETGATPMLAAAEKWLSPTECQDNIRPMVKALYDEGYDPSDDCANDVIEVLLRHGADINARDKDGLTALKIARLRGRDKTVELLISRGAQE